MIKDKDLNSITDKNINSIEEKNILSSRKIILSLFIISVTALFIRLYFWTPGIPLTLDALQYFWYANDLSISGHFPKQYIENNGWPSFLSIFFSIYHSNNFLDYMIVQRVLTIAISTISIIPVYLLLTRFFQKQYAIAGSALFILEPRIVQNSTFGITDPLYILLITTAIYLFLSSNRKLNYASFGIIALSSLVRSEGLIVFVIFSIMFFVKNGKNRKTLGQYAIAVVIFLMLLLPMTIVRIQTTGSDHLFSFIAIESKDVFTSTNSNIDSSGTSTHSIIQSFEFLIWSTIPIFIVFIPFGILKIFKNRDFDKNAIIALIIIMLFPAIYATSRFPDVRYFFPIYPLFCILSLFTIKAIGDKVRHKNIFLILLISGILLASFLFLSLKNVDVQHEKEALSIANYVSNMTSGVNSYYPESKYIPVSVISNYKFPIISANILTAPKIISTDGFNSLSDYLRAEKDNGLTDLVIDENKNRPQFLIDVFYHEKNYPYLTKVFDSWDHGYKYHLKIYKIDYEQFKLSKQG